MVRSIAATIAAVAAVSLAACGSGTQAGPSAHISPEAAKSRIERASHVNLAAQQIPADARDQGLLAAYSNAATAVSDKQVVGLFVMKDAKVAGKVSDLVRSSAPQSAHLLVHNEVIVVYAAAGSDHGEDVKRAVEAL